MSAAADATSEVIVASTARRPCLSANQLPLPTLVARIEHPVILLVEDEPLVRRAVQDALAAVGYKVHVAANAREAIAELSLDPDIAVMVTDLVMPGMDGRELAEKALGDRPDLKVILATGHNIAATGCALPALSKPYTAEELSRLIQQVAAQD